MTRKDFLALAAWNSYHDFLIGGDIVGAVYFLNIYQEVITE